MREDLRLLLALADPISPVTPERAEALFNESDPSTFPGLLELAGSHRVDGYLGARLHALPADVVPPDLRDPLVRALHRNKLRAMGALRERDRILAAFAQHGIPCIVLKGADLAFRMYPDPGARPFEDLDLLVHESNVSRAEAALRALDYTIPPDLLPSPLIRKLHFHLPFVHRDGRAFVEVHWRLVDRHTMNPRTLDRVWAGAAPCPEGWQVLSPAMYAAYLAVHLEKHGVLNQPLVGHDRATEILLHPWADSRLIWFIDLWLLAARHALEPSDILAAGEGLDCRAEVERTLHLLQQLFPSCPWNMPTPARSAPLGRVGQSVIDRLLKRILEDLAQQKLAQRESPWLLTTNKKLHIRPIRMFSRRKSRVKSR